MFFSCRKKTTVKATAAFKNADSLYSYFKEMCTLSFFHSKETKQLATCLHTYNIDLKTINDRYLAKKKAHLHTLYAFVCHWITIKHLKEKPSPFANAVYQLKNYLETQINQCQQQASQKTTASASDSFSLLTMANTLQNKAPLILTLLNTPQNSAKNLHVDYYKNRKTPVTQQNTYPAITNNKHLYHWWKKISALPMHPYLFFLHKPRSETTKQVDAIIADYCQKIILDEKSAMLEILNAITVWREMRQTKSTRIQSIDALENAVTCALNDIDKHLNTFNIDGPHNHFAAFAHKAFLLCAYYLQDAILSVDLLFDGIDSISELIV